MNKTKAPAHKQSCEIMDGAKWSQGFQDFGLVKPMEEMVSNNTCSRGQMLEKKTKPPEQLNCPRCKSTNTKFCYYNNYSLTQPRYFCKSCRRYWTEGGSLRNVPVGGGSRKNRRSLISNSSSSSATQNPKPHKNHQDLNLGFPPMLQQPSHGPSQYLQVGKIDHNNDQQIRYTSGSALELLRSTGMVSRGELNSFVQAPGAPDMAAAYSNGFSMQDYKPSLGFSLDGLENRGATGSIHGVQENGGRVFFPFGTSNTTNEVDQNKEQQGNSAGYWTNGVLGGGGSW